MMSETPTPMFSQLLLEPLPMFSSVQVARATPPSAPAPRKDSNEQPAWAGARLVATEAYTVTLFGSGGQYGSLRRR